MGYVIWKYDVFSPSIQELPAAFKTITLYLISYIWLYLSFAALIIEFLEYKNFSEIETKLFLLFHEK